MVDQVDTTLNIGISATRAVTDLKNLEQNLDEVEDSGNKAAAAIAKTGEAGDKASPKVTKAAGAAKKADVALDQLEDSAKGATVGLDKLGNEAKTVETAVGRVGDRARRAKAPLEEIDSTAERTRNSFNLLRVAATAIFGGIFARSLIKTISNFETLQFQLGIVFEDVERGTQVFRDIQEIAEMAPFSVQQLTESVVKLRAAGLEPTRKQLELFSDVSSVTADSVGTLRAITDLFARTTAGGLGLRDLNRLADRGIPVFDILSEKIGVSRLEISKMGKTADGARRLLRALTAGLEERFGGAAEKAASTLTVAISNMGDAWERLLLAFGDAGSRDALIGAVTAISKALTFMAENIDYVVVGINAIATAIFIALIPSIKAMTVALLSNPLGIIVTVIGGVVLALYHFRRVIFETIIYTWEVSIPNAVDRAAIGFLKFRQSFAETLNGIIDSINAFTSQINANTSDTVRQWLGIGDDFLQIPRINTEAYVSRIDELLATIDDRIQSYVPPPLEFLDVLVPAQNTGGGLSEDEDSETGGGGGVNGPFTDPRRGGAGGSSDGSDAMELVREQQEQEEALYVEHLERQHEQLRRFLGGQVYIIEENFSNRMNLVNELFEEQLIGEEERNQLLIDLEMEKQKRITAIAQAGLSAREKFEKSSAKEKTKTILGELVQVTAGVSQSNKTLFELNKAASIGTAIIDTIEGANRALKDYPAPWSYAVAATTYASGIARVAAIRNTQFGSSATGGGSGSGGGGNVIPSQVGNAGNPNQQPIRPLDDDSNRDPGRIVTINIEGNVYDNDDFREAIVEALEVAEGNDERQVSIR